MLLRQALDGRVSPGTAKWAAATLQYAVMVGGVYTSARYLLDFDPRAVAASLGILGIIVAVSSTQITQNILAGILITINRPVQLEEWIVVGEMPTTGLCEHHSVQGRQLLPERAVRDPGRTLRPGLCRPCTGARDRARGGA